MVCPPSQPSPRGKLAHSLAWLPMVHTPPRPGDVRHSLACIDKATELLGYHPTVDVSEGLRRSLEFYRSLLPATVATV